MAGLLGNIRQFERVGLSKDVVALQRFIENRRQIENTSRRLGALQALPLEQRQNFQGASPVFPQRQDFPTAQSTAGGQ